MDTQDEKKEENIERIVLVLIRRIVEGRQQKSNVGRHEGILIALSCTCRKIGGTQAVASTIQNAYITTRGYLPMAAWL